ncbi:hypothetical protein GHT09_003627 [Marmota monax]|uniref:Mucin-19-like n=1 Tax=Marmota monax TaxID=9995 RepID=A0A834QXN2_MARMO|nr:hypothetical protein GHT09_003627 [Marmota monax]
MAPTKKYCNKVIGTYFENCEKVATVSNGYKKVCIDEYCQNGDKNSTCDTYSELSRLCASDGPGIFENWREDSDVVCGYLLDDIGEKGKCVLKDSCPCESNGKVYQPGEVREGPCGSQCTCQDAKWSCTEASCPGRCKVEGSLVTTFDGNKYNHPGNCHFLAIHDKDWSVSVELRPCKTGQTGTCLNSVTLALNSSVSVDKFTINSDGTVTSDMVRNRGYYYSDKIQIFKESTSYIQVQTDSHIKMQVQIVPVMQLYISMPPNQFTDTVEKFAESNCEILLDSSGPFASCHSIVNPKFYHEECKKYTCSCEKSQDCLCTILGNYVKACAEKETHLDGWRTGRCEQSCPSGLVFKYNVKACNSSCRSLSERDRSCDVEDIPVDGCTCPDGTYQNNEGNCVQKSQCDCYINDEVVQPDKTIQIDDNKCVCQEGVLLCQIPINLTLQNCSGGAEYVDCSDPKAQRRTDKTCSTWNIPAFDDQNIVLQDGKVTTVKTTESKECELSENAYSVHTVGLYLILKLQNGMSLIWDKNTRISVLLDPQWQGKVCGLCGNNNGDLKDDFTTRYSSVATGALEFGNSWKTSQECSDTVTQSFPCDSNPYCKAWAVRKCEIIRDSTFTDCHSKVDPNAYYEACIEEACACDMEGKYQGFCTAVAMYAEACSAAGVCVSWRKPNLCPVYCDYYNAPGECSWHYEPCGTVTAKTCKDRVIGKKFSAVLEGGAGSPTASTLSGKEGSTPGEHSTESTSPGNSDTAETSVTISSTAGSEGTTTKLSPGFTSTGVTAGTSGTSAGTTPEARGSSTPGGGGTGATETSGVSPGSTTASPKDSATPSSTSGSSKSGSIGTSGPITSSAGSAGTTAGLSPSFTSPGDASGAFGSSSGATPESRGGSTPGGAGLGSTVSGEVHQVGCDASGAPIHALLQQMQGPQEYRQAPPLPALETLLDLPPPLLAVNRAHLRHHQELPLKLEMAAPLKEQPLEPLFQAKFGKHPFSKDKQHSNEEGEICKLDHNIIVITRDKDLDGTPAASSEATPEARDGSTPGEAATGTSVSGSHATSSGATPEARGDSTPGEAGTGATGSGEVHQFGCDGHRCPPAAGITGSSVVTTTKAQSNAVTSPEGNSGATGTSVLLTSTARSAGTTARLNPNFTSPGDTSGTTGVSSGSSTTASPGDSATPFSTSASSKSGTPGASSGTTPKAQGASTPNQAGTGATGSGTTGPSVGTTTRAQSNEETSPEVHSGTFEPGFDKTTRASNNEVTSPEGNSGSTGTSVPITSTAGSAGTTGGLSPSITSPGGTSGTTGESLGTTLGAGRGNTTGQSSTGTTSPGRPTATKGGADATTTVSAGDITSGTTGTPGASSGVTPEAQSGSTPGEAETASTGSATTGVVPGTTVAPGSSSTEATTSLGRTGATRGGTAIEATTFAGDHRTTRADLFESTTSTEETGTGFKTGTALVTSATTVAHESSNSGTSGVVSDTTVAPETSITGTTGVTLSTSVAPGSSSTGVTTVSPKGNTGSKSTISGTTGAVSGSNTSPGNSNTGATTGISETPSSASETGTTEVVSGTTIPSESSNTGATTSTEVIPTTGVKLETGTPKESSETTTAGITTTEPQTCLFNNTDYEIGTSFDDPSNPCVSYSCNSTGFVAVVQDCPKQSWCAEEDRIYDSRKCCYTCKNNCRTSPVNVTVKYNGCKKRIQMAKCMGECKRTLKYNYDLFQLENSCLCCREDTYEFRDIALDCPDGSTLSYRYRHTTTCSCLDLCEQAKTAQLTQ